MRTLAIDTATQSLSVALLIDGQLIAETTTNTRIQHSTQLLPLIDNLFSTVKWKPEQLEQIIVTRGPGSYTGLRIGVTAAKTLAQTLNIPLFSVSSLEALLPQVAFETGKVVLPFINARRQTVFAGAYRLTADGYECLLPVRHQRFQDWLDKVATLDIATDQIELVSPDTLEFKEAIVQQFGEDFFNKQVKLAIIHASDLPQLQLQAEDVAVFIPEYAKLAEAEENWQSAHPDQAKEAQSYVERTD